MKNIEISILNYENQLLASRKQLNDLIYEFDNQKINHYMISYKINYLQNEIDYMNRQLNMLRAEWNEQLQGKDIQRQDVKPVQDVGQRQEAPVQRQTIPQPEAILPQDNERIPAPPTPPQGKVRSDNRSVKSMDLENIIGKSWMGIFASILIFVSFILFATLLAPFITDTIKMAAMYVVSISFTLFGLIKLRKHHNRLYLAICSCGVGAVYISLFLTNLYFKAMGDTTLYLFILIWAVFVCYLSRWRDRVFQIIGQCGITIAVFFGIILCMDTQDAARFLLLGLFFAVTAAVFYVSSYSREFHKNIVNNIFNVINLFLLLIGFCMMDAPRLFSGENLSGGWSTYFIEITGFVILFFLLLQFVLFLISRLKENNAGFGLFMNVNTILMIFFIFRMTYGAENSLRGALYLGIGFLLLAVIERKFVNRKDDGRILMQLFALPLFVLSVYMIAFFQDHIGLSLIMILFVLLGYRQNDAVYKYGSLVMAVIYCFADMKYPMEHLCLGLLFFAIFAVFIYLKKEQYHISYKLCAYFIGLLFVSIGLYNLLDGADINRDVSRTVIFTIAALLNILASKSIFIKDFQTMQTEEISAGATRITNGLFMAYSLYVITDTDNDICHFILVLLAVVLFMANTKNLLERHNGMWPGIYIGIKLTVLVITILSSYDTVNYVISISVFVFAIISIIIGFKFNFKSFRIYGLILSLISVAKLILVDISYDNTLGHALSFFVCGILCFVISMIYHLIDKKVTR